MLSSGVLSSESSNTAAAPMAALFDVRHEAVRDARPDRSVGEIVGVDPEHADLSIVNELRDDPLGSASAEDDRHWIFAVRSSVRCARRP